MDTQRSKTPKILDISQSTERMTGFRLTYLLLCLSLTGFDCRKSSKESNGVHDALLSFEATGFQDPCRAWMNDEYIEKETSEPGEIVFGYLAAHFVFLIKLYVERGFTDPNEYTTGRVG